MTIDPSKYIVLFENCQLTRGASRTLLADLQRGSIEFLDNEIYSVFTEKNRTHTIEQLISLQPAENRETLTEYFSYLLENEYAFLCDQDELELYPVLNKKWDHYSVISNCIIDFKKETEDLNDYIKVVRELDELGCEAIQIRDYNGLSIVFLKKLLAIFTPTILCKIELLLKHTEDLENYKKLLDQFPRVTELILHSSETDVEFKNNAVQKVFISKQKITDESCCGVISIRYFNLDLNHFLESFEHNTCLNRKVSIDADGFIKNCPSLKTSYGHIRTTSIKNCIAEPGFRKLWFLSKDKIKTCSICEFRNICTDCRAYHSADDSIEKPSTCSYDPLTMTWTS